MAYFKPPRPLKKDKGAGPGAGLPSDPKSDIFRSGIVVPRGPLLNYTYPDNRWNYPLSTNYSMILYPSIGLPFDTTKPRRGPRGEILGTRYSDLADFLVDEWERMKVPRKVRERQLLLEARAELNQKIKKSEREP